MNKHFCSSIFVINPDDYKILLIKHKDFKKWLQPGGHIEHNETPEEAALREVYEETGVKVKLIGERFPREEDYIRPLGIQCNRKEDYTQIDILYFGIPVGDINPVCSNDDEAIAAKWFSREELEELNVFEDIKITYDYIIRNILKK